MNKPKKFNILFVSAPFGGIEIFFKNIQRLTSEREDIEASWIWIEYNPHELISRIPLISSFWTLKGGLVARSRVKKLENTGKEFDAVFFNHTIPATFLTRFRKRVPMFLSLDVTASVLAPFTKWYRNREVERNDKIVDLKQKLICSVYHDAVHIFTWSNLVRDSLIHDYKIDPYKASVVPPGIDLKQWKVFSNNNRTSAVKSTPYKILFVGSDLQRKGGDMLLRIAQREEFRNYEFHFVTRTLQVNPSKNCIVHSKIQANSEQLKNLYQSADLFVLPTRADFAPTMAICEAMASGLPVISTAIGGLEEIVKNGETGYTIPVDDESALMSAISNIMKNDALRFTLGSNARKLVEEQYNLEKNLDNIITQMMSVKK